MEREGRRRRDADVNETEKMRERSAPCQCEGKRQKRLKLEPVVILPTSRASPFLHFTTHYIEVIAPNAAKRGSTTLALKAGVIAAIIIEPQAKEERGHQKAVDERGDLQAHGTIKAGDKR
jgi:hypothetical protein